MQLHNQQRKRMFHRQDARRAAMDRLLPAAHLELLRFHAALASALAGPLSGAGNGADRGFLALASRVAVRPVANPIGDRWAVKFV